MLHSYVATIVNYCNLVNLCQHFMLLPGVILAVSFDNMEALERLRTLHKDERLSPILEEIFMRPEVLKKVGARSIDFRVRLFDEEYEDCRLDILEKKFNQFTLVDRGAFISLSLFRKLYESTNFVTVNDSYNSTVTVLLPYTVLNNLCKMDKDTSHCLRLSNDLSLVVR